MTRFDLSLSRERGGGLRNAHARKLVMLDLAGVPPDPDLRRRILLLDLSFDETCDLAEAIVGHLRREAARRKRGPRRARAPHEAADRELLATLELMRERPLTPRDIDAHAAEAAGRARPETKRVRLRRLYRRVLAERVEAERRLAERPDAPAAGPAQAAR